MSERIIGRPMPIIDAVEKVSGATVFINDLELPGALVGKALRSPHPHARILNIDTSRAERLPGVAAVLSRNNTPEAPFGINIKDEAAFCREKVRYEGDEVAERQRHGDAASPGRLPCRGGIFPGHLGLRTGLGLQRCSRRR